MSATTQRGADSTTTAADAEEPDASMARALSSFRAARNPPDQLGVHPQPDFGFEAELSDLKSALRLTGGQVKAIARTSAAVARSFRSSEVRTYLLNTRRAARSSVGVP